MVSFALISDIHFGRLSRTNEFAVPGEQIEDENHGAVSLGDSLIRILKERKVQYLFIAGDLTSGGSPQEFHYCEEKLLLIAEAANISPNNIVWGLGNHDVDWKISRLYNECASPELPDEVDKLIRKKYQLIAASASLSNIDQLPRPSEAGPAPLSGIIENDDFVVIVLNSGLCCTHDQEFSHGKLTKQQLEWFNAAAGKYREDERWKMVLMHHHPYNYSYHIPSIDISMIEEGSNFLDIAGESGINLVLHGHRHHPKAETIMKSGWKNPITFICAGSLAVNASQRSDGDIPNTFHILELTHDLGVLNLYNFEYSSACGWIPLKSNCPETPMDSKMKLGKIYNETEIERAILALDSFDGATKLIQMDDLDGPLHFLPINKLNKKIRELLSNTYNISGLFPDDVYLMKK